MAKVITFNGKQYLTDQLSEEVQAIVNTIEVADQELLDLNKKTILVNLAKENLYQKLAATYGEDWNAAEVEIKQPEAETETKPETETETK